MNPASTIFVGIDCHKEEHTAHLINGFFESLGTVETKNREDAFPSFVDTILAKIPTGYIPVFGLEGAGGLGRALSLHLISLGYTVKEINPIYVDRSRKMRPHPDKSDQLDALLIAKVLLTEFSSLPEAQTDELSKAIHLISLERDSLIKEQTSLKNRFHALIFEPYADYKEMFNNPFSKSALLFFSTFPHPSNLKGVGPSRLFKLLKRVDGTFSLIKAKAILANVNKDKALSLLDDARSTVIVSLTERLSSLVEKIHTLTAKLSELVERSELHLGSLTGVSTVIAAKLIGDIGDISRFKSAASLAKYAGIAPQDKSSGKRGRKKKSLRGKRSLNTTIHYIALTQIRLDKRGNPLNTAAREYYLKKISEGKTKRQALTCLKRRLCDIIFAMMRDKSIYTTSKITTSIPEAVA